MDRNKKISDIMYLLLNASEEELLAVEELLKKVSTKEEESKKVFSAVNQTLTDITANTTNDTVETVVTKTEISDDKEISQIISSETYNDLEQHIEEITYKAVNWRGYIPKEDDLLDYFNSMGEGEETVNPYRTIPGLFHNLIEKIDENTYRVTVVPKNLNAICCRHSRGTSHGWIQIDLSKEDFYKLPSLVDIDIKMEDGTDMFDALKKANRFDNKMPKVMIPLSNENQVLKEEDIKFAKILFEVNKFMGMRNRGSYKSFCVKELGQFFGISILNNKKSLSFEEIKYFSLLFDEIGATNYMIDSSKPKYESRERDSSYFAPKGNPYLIAYKKTNYKGDFPLFMGVPIPEFQDKFVLGLDIENGLCSNENIKELYFFLNAIFLYFKDNMLYNIDNIDNDGIKLFKGFLLGELGRRIKDESGEKNLFLLMNLISLKSEK